MIKVFCDLCKQEILNGNGLSSNLSRRVQLSPISLSFTLEYPVDGKPDHVCLTCAAKQLESAIEVLRLETANA